MAESKTWSNTASSSYTQHNRDSMIWTSTSKKTNSITSCCSNNSSSSDEEDQEEIQRLREAAISVELHTEDDSNAKFSAHNQNNNGQAKQPSLRGNQSDHTDYNQLQTTPSFQKHVAKKLSQILDQELEFSECYSAPDDLHTLSDSGIKLLSTSKDYIKLNEAISVKKRPLKKTHYRSSSSNSDSSDEDAKFAEAATSYNAIKLKDQLLSAFDASIQKTGNDSKAKQKKKKKKVKKEKD
ncbi:protein CUSTOS-like isoform X2 [Octopus bimaculoides]|uniref:protein CUSTOS-like isoform X2 n=1 Tax=Octopus bimaculoides TaxID=37653 RepID=UPI00071CAF53|nr:protein CUSTOS-like isoform X2 [Octopus bimaculoides]|eukprot:XP_014785104.1 PREDICTED: uncharacterized protein C12orf43-like isoform X2 [Octopus bimaculoides]